MVNTHLGFVVQVFWHAFQVALTQPLLHILLLLFTCTSVLSLTHCCEPHLLLWRNWTTLIYKLLKYWLQKNTATYYLKNVLWHRSLLSVLFPLLNIIFKSSKLHLETNNVKKMGKTCRDIVFVIFSSIMIVREREREEIFEM